MSKVTLQTDLQRANTESNRRFGPTPRACGRFARQQLKPYTLHPTPHTLHPTTHTLQPTPCTLHPTPFTRHTRHPAPYTLPLTPYTLNPNRRSSRESSSSQSGIKSSLSIGCPCTTTRHRIPASASRNQVHATQAKAPWSNPEGWW